MRDEIEDAAELPPDPAPKQTRIKAPRAPKEPRGGSGLDSTFKKGELRRKLLLAFNGIAQLWGADGRYVEDDFDAMAESVLDVVNLLPPVGRLIIRFVGVFGAIGDAMTKASELWAARSRFRPKPTVPRPTNPVQPDGNGVVDGGHKSIFDRR